MSSTLFSSPVGLVVYLPKLLPGQYYQVTSVGGLHRSHSSLNREIDTYFQRVGQEGKQFIPLGSPLMRRLNLHQAASLKAGTLFNDKGDWHMHSQHAIPDSREFSLGPLVELCTSNLGTVLPQLNYRKAYEPLRQFLSDPLLRSLKQLPVTTLQAPTGELLIISQFELARAFYFWAGPKFIDFLFHPTRTSDICDPQQAPTTQNKLTAKVLIRPSANDPGNVFDLDHRFSAEQVLMLAQMRFSIPFRRAIEQMNLRQVLADSKGLTLPIELDLALDKQIKVKANGVAFVHRNQRFFWVCSMFERSNYFCFDYLHYTTLFDPRSVGQLAIGASPIPLPQAGVVTQLNLKNNPQQDSNQAGSSAYGGPDVLLPTGDTLDLPLIKRNRKAVKQALHEARRGQRTGLPTVLTQRAGGNDLDIAKVNLRPAWEAMDSQHYFDAVIQEFIRIGYTVSRLQVNNPKSTFGRGFSVPAETQEGDAPYQVGVACIQRLIGEKKICGYFFHVLHSRSKRSAFLYRTSLEQFTMTQLNWVLREIKFRGDDWVETRKHYETLWKKMVVAGKRQGGIRPALILHARNRKSVELDVKRCINELVKELSY
jgi:hypothetical protein